MSIAKKLAGGGGAFGALAQGDARGHDEVVARSEALDATGRVRRASSAPVSSIVFNPLNPRKTMAPETIEELAESLSRQQIVPITVVSRVAFLDAHPDQAAAIGDADFVALDGNRRLMAARHAGLQTLRVDLNDELVDSASDMVEAALIANAHREDVSPLEEAQAIEQLLTTVYDGNQAAVARKLGKSRAWVGQRLALLHLAPELQEQASSGELAIEEARKIGAEARAGKLTAAEQLAKADAAKEAARAKEQAKAATKAGTRPAGLPHPAAPDNAVHPAPSGQQAPAVHHSAEPAPEAHAPAASSTALPTATGITPDSLGVAAQTILATAVPEQREADQTGQPSIVNVTFDPSDFIEAAHTIRSAMDLREAVNVTSALLALLQREPGFGEIIQEIRSRTS
ncbi:ParB/RepB/Spo0J family partition protein [Kitasatospora sp. NPDC085895]|uniref:ParB/RepB/Spo0J family partition protein n=1 Tax=Kitasatospora sp. NPDC085895 TaxID=3155057 RepID=UPI00344B0F12